MKENPNADKYEFDAVGQLAREPDETDEAYIIRTATVLHQEGLSPNTVEDVVSQYDEPEPEVEIEEGEELEAFDERKRGIREEWETENARRREEGFAAVAQENKERLEAASVTQSDNSEDYPAEEAVEEEAVEENPRDNRNRRSRNR